MTEDKPELPKSYDSDRVREAKSFGVNDERHWATARKEMNLDEIEFLRERSRAPGVAEGGALRNHYCMECHGVIPLEYNSGESVEDLAPENCPHCGAELDGGVRMMFNWVEMDQIHGSDFRALLPFFVAGAVFLVLLGFLLWHFFG
ncbi:MAG: hypothetical protein ACI8X5_002108 [Planctomycetota bacterium]|jgi:hypothetical protein